MRTPPRSGVVNTSFYGVRLPSVFRCPQGTVLPTLPPGFVLERLRRAHISGSTWKRSGLGMRKRVSERSVQTLPVGSPFQDVVLTAELHRNPETSLERLVPLVEFLTAWKLLPNISR